MPPFQYQSYQSPYANTIAQLLAHQGDPAAQAAVTVAAANARAGEQVASAYGGAAQGIANAGSNIMQQVLHQQEIAPQLALEKINLAKAQHQQAGQAAYARIAQGDTLPTGDVGPRQPSYLTDDHLFDVPAISARLAETGYGDIAPELVQHAEAINESITKTAVRQQELEKQQTIMRGNLAAGAMALTQRTGMPVLGAMDFVVQPALKRGTIKAEDYAAFRQQIAGLPPEQQMTALKTVTQDAGRYQPERTVAKDATVFDVYGNAIAEGVKSPPPKLTPEELQLDAFARSINKTDRSQLTDADLQKYETRKATQNKVLTPDELSMDAFARAIGRTGRADLTDAEIQNFEKRKAQIAASTQLSTHIAERTYDQAHPPPVDQTKLENSYRTVLLRAVSSRSGTLGREDTRVADANHMLASFDQYLDPNTGQYNIPAVPLKEIALGTAKLMSGGGNVGVEAMKNFEAATLKGDIAAAVSYLSGQPQPSTTQGVATMLRDIIQRQGQTAVGNRDQSLEYLHMIAPTELEQERVDKLDRAQLTHLHASRLIKLPSGQRVLQTSDDGGKTWK
jgi:hypothetical protein